jgi:hypothetical protein
MTTTPRLYLPGDIKFSDPTGLVWGTGHCALKDATYGREGKTMTSIKDFAEFGEFEMRTGRKKTLEISLEGMSEEVEALLTASDLVATGFQGYFSEVVGIGVLGVMPPLTHTPILPGSEVVRKASDAAGKVITERLKFVVGVAAVDEYSIANATGIITTDPAYVLYCVVNYAMANAAGGVTLIEDDAAEIPLMDVTIIARAWDPVQGKKGSVVYVFEQCELIDEPGDSLSIESPNVATARFNVAGQMNKSVYFA